MADETRSFDELLGDHSAGEPTASNRSRWVLTASVGCVLIGIASVVGAWLIVPFDMPRPAAAPPSESSSAERSSLDGSSSVQAPSSVAIAPAETSNDRPDDPWLVGVAERTGIPTRALAAYASAARMVRTEQPGCGLGWNTLAGIGFVESAHGTIGGSALGTDGTARPAIVGIPLDGTRSDAIPDTDGGTLDGDPVWDRAVGPMQFIPSTWAEWGADGNGDAVADPHNIDDAAYSAARYLCHAGDLTDPGTWIAAIASYNDSLDYNHRVAEAANGYATAAGGSR